MALLDIAAIRHSHPVAQVVGGAGVKLRPIAGELRGCCPFHPDRSPSFFVFAAGDRWHCFGCGLTGDVLDFVQRAYSLSMREAAERLCNGDLPLIDAPAVGARPSRDNSFALELWRQAVAIENTPAAGYLRRRGITADLPSSLRYAMLKPPKDSGVAEANGRSLLPGMVALVTGPDGEPTGVQRTFLTQDGRKAASQDGKVKFSLGLVRGGAIHLGPALAMGMALTEGVEDALSLLEMGAPSAWAAAGAGMLPSVELPPAVRSVVIGADGDMAGQHAAAKAVEAFARGGREVRVIYPGSGAKDFNDELRGVAA